MNVKVNDSTFQSVKPLWLFWPFPLQLAGNGMRGIRGRGSYPNCSKSQAADTGTDKKPATEWDEVVGNSVVIC